MRGSGPTPRRIGPSLRKKPSVALIRIGNDRKVLDSVLTGPDGGQWMYQSARCFQISPAEVGLMVNIRPGGAHVVDLAVGNDLLVLSSLDDVASAKRFVINRSAKYTCPEDGREFLLSMVWSKVAFVPVGARRADGSPHPHASTGFGCSHAVGYPPAFSTRTPEAFERWSEYEPTRGVENPLSPKALAVDPNPVCINYVHQYRYDGSQFEVSRIDEIHVPGDHGFEEDEWEWGLRSGLPDGDDLLFPLVARRRDDGARVAGLGRWHSTTAGWRVAEFTPVPGAARATEPTVERDRNGALYFTCRCENRLPRAQSIVVWRSEDGGRTWEVVIDEPDLRAASPITINRATDGSLYVLANPLDPVKRNRERLAVWPLSAEGDHLAARMEFLDTTREFGLFRGEYDWYADHPIGEVIRLADGAWHGVITHRGANRIEVGSDLPPTPWTGTYLADVLSDGEPLPRWRFE